MSGMNKYKTLAANTFLISVGTFGSKLLVFLMVRFYTGYLTPADYGTADLLTHTANLLIPLCSLGITDGVFRFAIDQTEQKDSVFTIGFLTVSIGCGLLWLVKPWIEQIPAVGGAAWLIEAFVTAACFHSLCAQFIRAKGNTTLFAIQGLLNTALVIGLNILFLACFHLGVTGYVLSVVVADLLTTIMLAARERLWRQLKMPASGTLFRAMLRYSIPLIPTSVFWWITSASDRYMVTAFLGSSAAGLYSMAYKIPTILTLVSMVFMEAWQLSAVTEAAGNREDHIRFYTKVWSAFQAVLFLCGSSIIALTQVEVKLLAADSYFEAWRYIPLLAMATVFSSFCSFTGSVYTVTKKSSLSLFTSMTGAGINIVGNLLLIPSRFGVHGAAIATFFSYLIVFIIRTISVRKLIPFQLRAAPLLIGTLILAVQTVFIVFQIPAWQMVQAAGVGLVLLSGRKPLLACAAQMGSFIRQRRKS